jgi:L-fuconolactonase
MPDFPIVDAHVHLASPGRFGYGWTRNAPQLNREVLPADLMAAASPVRIERFVFVEVDVDPPQHVAEAAWVQTLADADPRLSGMVACLPLERGAAVAADLEAIRANPCLRGVRRLIQNQPDPDFCIRPDFLEGLKRLAPHDLAFDICVFHHHLPNVNRMVRACPELRFVLDHIGKPAIRAGQMDPWRQNLRELARLPNVWCKISGVTTEADHRSWTPAELRPYIEHAIDCFGFDRCMYGGDWHVSELAGSYPQWVEVVDWVTEGASDDEKRRLWRESATEFYRLDRRP